MSISSLIADLRSAAPLIEPSLLSCDFRNLAREIERVEQTGVRSLHLDVMDGHFVPNISYGPVIVEAVRRLTELTLDVHLMISDPGKYAQAFRDAGADLITIHIEAVPEPRPVLEQIRSLGAGAGITLNPPTPVEAIEPHLDDCDLVLIMSVMPGFGGQQFDPAALPKIRRVRALRPEKLISVDGGVDEQTVGPAAAAGADLFVTGSAFFSHSNYGQFVAEMTDLAKTSKATQV